MDPVLFDEYDIIKRLDALNINKSPGPDLLHPRVLKEIKHEIAQPLKVIFECSLRTSSLPLDWRSGNIVPIYKKGKKCCTQNYRRVGQLNQCYY
jgi:hypothetical protein